MDYNNRVKNMSILNALKNHEIGEIIFVEDDEKFMVYTEDGWSDLDTSKSNINAEGFHMSEYELCKMTLSSAKTIPEEELEKLEEKIESWVSKDAEAYLLYGQEKHIFDVFQYALNSEYSSLSKALIDTLRRFGEIYRVDIGDNGLEIWIKYHDEEPTFLMLMEWGIINYG